MEVSGNIYSSGLTGSTASTSAKTVSASTSADAIDAFKLEIQKLEEEYEINKNKEKSDDWREMDDREWDKLMDSIDKYIDSHIEELREMKELQQEAANKAAANAPAGMEAAAASSAALQVAASGFFQAGSGKYEDILTDNSADVSVSEAVKPVQLSSQTSDEWILSKEQEEALFRDDK